MTIAFDSSWGITNGSSVSSITTGFHTPSSSTSLIVIGITVSGGITLSSVTDSNANTYSIVGPYTTVGGNHGYIAYCPSPTTSSMQFTAHFSGAGNGVILPLSFLGTAATSPFDVSISAASSTASGTLDTGASPATTYPNELLISVAALDSGSVSSSWTAGSGYTVGTQYNGSPIDSLIEYQIASATGTYHGTATNALTTKNWGILLATFADTPVSPTLTASTGVFTLTGESATLSTSSGAFNLTASTGVFTLTGENVTLTAAGNFQLVVNPGSFDLVGGLSTSDDQMEAVVGQYLLVGGVVSFNNATFALTLSTGAFALTGPATILTLSQNFPLTASTGFYTLIGEQINGSLICAVIQPTTAILNLEIVTDAFQLIGVVDETQTPSPEQGSNGLRKLNDYLLNQAADGLRLGWWRQTDLSAVAPLRQEDVWGVKMLLARELAAAYGITITDPILLAHFADAERMLTKRAIRYFESDLSELSRPQGGPWGGPSWI